ncbi:MAG: UPF0104 family protein [Candidatus Dadabacteria bacterium]|nr:MAG: UPF0104 family protein [Candidatus Dadabacteria bacterium]
MKRANLARNVTVSLIVGGLCAYLAFRRVAAADVLAALARFDDLYLAAAVAISLAIQVIRAWRWQLELRPLARLPFGLLWKVVAVSYMMINVLPARLGEPVRPLLLSWKTGLPVSSIVANWVFEKTMDTAALVLFIHLALITNDLPPWAYRAAEGSLGLLAVLALAVVGFWARGTQLAEATIGPLLPARARSTFARVLSSARLGLEILPDRRLVLTVFAATVALWSLPVLSSYVVILGFGFDLPPPAALVVFVAIGVGTALPHPPGMFGVFQIAAVVALGLFGVPKADALAYGLVLNAIQFVTLVAQGLVALPFLDVSLERLTRGALASPR